MSAKRVAVIVGSLRKESLSRKIALNVIEQAKGRLDCRLVEIGELPLYNDDLEAAEPRAWHRFRSEVAAADAVLFVTPEYNRSIPGVLKNAVDVGSRRLAFWSGVQVATVKAPGSDTAEPVTVRITEVFRLEQGDWKLVHRHADIPAAAPTPARSRVTRDAPAKTERRPSH